MKKFIRRVVKTFKKLADANLLTFGQNVTVSMAAAVTTFPTPVPSLESIMDEAIRSSFQVLKHWLEYKVPKWLSVINSIQEFVCSEKGLRPGNYSYFSN